MADRDAADGRQPLSSILWRLLIFSAASNAAVIFVIGFGFWLWPQGLPAHSQNIFWLASGVNTACLLLFGLRYWPVVILDAFPAWLIFGQPLEITLAASLCNALEALLAAWLILRAGAFAGRFDGSRTVGALLIASIVAPLVNTLVMPAYFCASGLTPWSEYWRSLSNWNLSNGASLLIVTPLIWTLVRGSWGVTQRRKELALATIAGFGVACLAFLGVFYGLGLNCAFLAFPALIYVAVRFGAAETIVLLGLTLLAVYTSLIFDHTSPTPNHFTSAIWFVQAFCWMLAATGLMIAALSFERQEADHRALREQGRFLEASLGEQRARLSSLRYQLNPHFLFNSLNSIRATLPLSESVPRDMITDLADYLRSTLEQEDHEQVPLEDELHLVRSYLAIEQRRFGDRLLVSIDFDPGAAAKLVPSFLLQPLVENAIRHGLEETKSVCRIEIRACLDAEWLHLEVANSAPWKPEKPAPGIGLSNIRRRLQLLYQGRATFHIDKSDWVRVVIGLPL